MSQVITDLIQFTDTVTENLTYGTAIALPVQAKETTSYSWSNGTGTGKVNEHFEHTYTLAASASTTLTLSALTDDLGRSVAFAKVRKLFIYLSTVTDGDYLTVGNAGTHPWTAFLGGTTPTVLVTDLFVLVSAGTAGYAVSSGSSDQLKFVNSGSNSLVFTVGIAGE